MARGHRPDAAKTPALGNAGKTQRDPGCAHCPSPKHHTNPLAMNGQSPLPEGLVVPEVADAIHHSFIEFAQLVSKYGIAEADMLAVYRPIGEAIGWVAGAAVHYATRLGRMQGVERFFMELIDSQGEGIYQFELRRNPLTGGVSRRMS